MYTIVSSIILKSTAVYSNSNYVNLKESNKVEFFDWTDYIVICIETQRKQN